MVKRILQPFYAAYVVITFSVSVLAVFPFFVIISIGNNAAARRAIYTIIKVWARGWFWVIGMPMTSVGKRPAKGKYVVVANHISYLDTLVIFPALPGYFRALGKKETSKIPVIGFIYRQLVIMVDRSSAKSRSMSMRLLWRVLHKEGNIIIFPEGTFNETGEPLKEFYDGAFRLAINTKTQILPIIFPDTVDRWHYSAWWKLWPGRNRVVYLPAVDITGMTTDDVPELKQLVYATMEKAVMSYRGS